MSSRAKYVTKRRVCQQQRRRRGILARFLQLLLGGNSATRWSPRFGDKHSQQLALCFFSALLISAARKHSNAGDSSFFFWFYFSVPLMHLSWHFVSSCLMYRGASTTANLEGLKEGLPHGRREGCKQSLAFSFILLLFFCFPDDYAIPCCRYLLLGHACPRKKLCCFVLSSVIFVQIIHPPTTTASLSILSVCPTCKLVLAGKERGRKRGEIRQTKDVQSEQFCEERKTNDKYNMMLLWSDQEDH